jgi:hypothetical protein
MTEKEFTMKLKIIDIDFHRNGVCGAPFDVVLFEDEGDKTPVWRRGNVMLPRPT